MSTTSKFIKNFDAKNEVHVTWLKRMIDLAENIDPSRPTMLIDEINKNPMEIKLEQRDALDWPHIHFCLCAVYAKAVLRNKAFIPK
jgi:hypothetical protein